MPSARSVRAGSRWHTQNATMPSSAYAVWFPIAANALPWSAYAFTLVAEKTMVRPISSSSPELATSR